MVFPLPDGLDDDGLELSQFPVSPPVPDPDRPVSDWAKLNQELRCPGVMRKLLREDDRAAHPEGFANTRFCTHFWAWKRRGRPTSHLGGAFSATRQTYVGGEKVFVDFAGDTFDMTAPGTGEVHATKLFVAASRLKRARGTTGASNFTCAEVVATEGLEDCILADVRMFACLGGPPKAVVPDNLKSAVFKADRYDLGLNRSYAEIAAQYGTAIVLALPYTPSDKAKA